MDGPVAPDAFLDTLTAEDRAALEAVGAKRRYRAGEAIFHEGDDPGGVMVLLDGRVKVSATSVGGKETILSFPGPGDLLGEVSAMDGSPRAATAVALEAVEALALSGGAFRAFLEARPRISVLLLRSVLTRLRDADRQRVEFTAYDVTGRLARRLVELSERHGEPAERGVRITLPISQEELASWTGASREAVGKSLHLLRELGWIETERRSITVLDAEALRRQAM